MSDILHLGELLEILDSIPESVHDQPLFGWGELMSWRGNYAELTLTEPYANEAPITILDAFKETLDAFHKVFIGYKGGEFKMNASTLVWGDNYGDYDSKFITGIGFILDGKNINGVPRAQVLRSK